MRKFGHRIPVTAHKEWSRTWKNVLHINKKKKELTGRLELSEKHISGGRIYFIALVPLLFPYLYFSLTLWWVKKAENYTWLKWKGCCTRWTPSAETLLPKAGQRVMTKLYPWACFCNTLTPLPFQIKLFKWTRRFLESWTLPCIHKKFKWNSVFMLAHPSWKRCTR